MGKEAGFRDLQVWQTGMKIAEAVYGATSAFPDSERFGMTNQMRRAAISIPSNIAEGWGRNTAAHLANFIKIARGSANELDTLVELAHRIGYLSDEQQASLDDHVQTFGRQSHALLSSVQGRMVREIPTEYATS